MERPFDYSAFPGALATPLGGLWAALTLLSSAMLGAYGRAAAALAVLVISALALLALGRWFTRTGVLSTPALRRRGMNLEATRGSTRPSVWLMAHVDSKSQLVPMSVRVGGIVGVGVLWLVAIALAGVELGSDLPPLVWWALGLSGVLVSVPVILTLVGARSPGAVDNASGVAAVLAAAAELPAHAAVGVLVTDAEELGLAGARAWCRGNPRAIALNCDGVDDTGPIRVAYTGRRPHRIIDVVTRVAHDAGQDVHAARLFPGVLVDGVALADAGWESVTFMRGTAHTLRRIHTARDDLNHLTGSGIASVAHLLARTALELC